MKSSDLFTIISQVWLAATMMLLALDKPLLGTAVPAVLFALLSWNYAWGGR